MSNKKSRSFFDEHFRLEKINTLKDPLVKLNAIIRWEDFRPIIDTAFSVNDPSKGGRPNYDRVMMFKVLIIQRIYNLSDDAAEFQILDRMSFNRFLGLELCDNVPDSKTIWHYREQLVKGGVFDSVFDLLNTKLVKAGLVLSTGSIVDARITEVPRQRNSRDENKQIKKGDIPEDWKDNPNKNRQKDIDADWLRKNGKNYYGYKNHVKIDTDSKLITEYQVTPASVHDSAALDDLLNESDEGKILHADSAYSGEPCKKIIRKYKMKNKVHKKAYRNKPLSDYQKKKNTEKSSIRARVEHVFAQFWVSMAGNTYIRYIGLERIAATIGMQNIVYNLQRVCYIQTQRSRPILL
jgi:IS5 family transposase